MLAAAAACLRASSFYVCLVPSGFDDLTWRAHMRLTTSMLSSCVAGLPWQGLSVHAQKHVAVVFASSRSELDSGCHVFDFGFVAFGFPVASRHDMADFVSAWPSLPLQTQPAGADAGTSSLKRPNREAGTRTSAFVKWYQRRLCRARQGAEPSWEGYTL